LFHIFAAATGKARSPIVLCFDRGTTRTAVEQGFGFGFDCTITKCKVKVTIFNGRSLYIPETLNIIRL